ncbi:MAG: hypothetical protein AAF732_09695 [Pseudomonadota bacterium]
MTYWLRSLLLLMLAMGGINALSAHDGLAARAGHVRATHVNVSGLAGTPATHKTAVCQKTVVRAPRPTNCRGDIAVAFAAGRPRNEDDVKQLPKQAKSGTTEVGIWPPPVLRPVSRHWNGRYRRSAFWAAFETTSRLLN